MIRTACSVPIRCICGIVGSNVVAEVVIGTKRDIL